MPSGYYTVEYRDDLKQYRTWTRRLWLAVLVGAVLALPGLVADVTLDRFVFALIAVVGAVGLNLLTGYTGQVSLGNAGFYAISAIAAGYFGATHEWPFPVVVLLSGAAAALAGAVIGIPSLRLRGLYLLLATLALHFIAVFAFQKYQVKHFGFAGIRFPIASVFGFDLVETRDWYWFMVIVCAGAVIFAKNVVRSAEGRAWVAIRDRDIAASVIGVNVSVSKVKAFALSSAYVGVAGALFAYKLSAVDPDSFNLVHAIEYVAMIIIGGLGSIAGGVAGAIFITMLPQWAEGINKVLADLMPFLATFLTDNKAAIDVALYGVIVIAFLLFKPDGIMGFYHDIKRYVVRWPYTS